MLTPASADSRLAPMTATQLLAAVTAARVDGLSGTVTETASLGLPMLGTSTDGSVAGLVSGSHSLRVWYAGPTQQRVAMLDKSGELDVFHNGTDVWQWDSLNQVATHSVLATADASGSPTPTGTTDPQQLASQMLAAVGASTTITSGPQQKVAGREAYQLILTPHEADSRISSVTVSVDGQTHVPLGVQVYGPGNSDDPAVDVSYLDVEFATPAASMFTFTPPQSAVVTEAVPSTGVLGAVKTIGTGWTTVLELPDASSMLTGTAALAVKLLQPVQGAWGSGHLLDSKLLSGLVTDDGRIFVGAVDPSVLYAAAGSK